jgi:hypothetical protein
MNLSDEPSEETLQVLDSFEQQWIEESYPPDIHDFCTRLQDRPSFQERRTVWELAMTDLEFRWRRAKPSLRRSVNWYVSQLSGFGLTAHDIEDLRCHEWIVRSRWADKPTVTAFCLEHLPEADQQQLVALQNRLRTTLEAEFPMQCRVSLGGQPASDIQLHTPCTVGRQRSQEPPPLALIHNQAAESWRMIVAPRELNSVSRKQLQITRMSIDAVEIVPLSGLVDCFVESIRLPEGAHSEYKIGPRGIEVRFGHCILWLRRV